MKELEFGKGLNIVAVMVGGGQTLHLEGTTLGAFAANVMYAISKPILQFKPKKATPAELVK